ncbi:MAG: hypothetical protein HeimC2_09250 [Candidatus Heimdallarchaeota archaeon LC_2]|nr:MAG: hypothetical protein HeimC2_09250 [Candidatus Heimdallarchaeota archaeon LC_2]
MLYNFNFEHLSPNHISILKYNIIFCSIGEKKKINHPNIIELDPSYSEFQLKTKIIQALNSNLHQSEGFIGIDPGNAIGVCVLLNQVILETTVFYSKEKLISWIRSKLVQLNGINTNIKIGDGGGKNQEHIITLLKNSLPDRVKIEIIDEKNTSQKITSHLTSHEQAAIRIAKRKGYLI